ncbi:MAG: hypothetical protein M9894_37320 [Planctomycetes bacterium]|nr:hypothetical protein [Planctomycetota bacterium]
MAASARLPSAAVAWAASLAWCAPRSANQPKATIARSAPRATVTSRWPETSPGAGPPPGTSARAGAADGCVAAEGADRSAAWRCRSFSSAQMRAMVSLTPPSAAGREPATAGFAAGLAAGSPAFGGLAAG